MHHQGLHRLVAPEMAFNDTRQVLWLHGAIDGSLRVDLDHRAEATWAQAACLGQVNVMPLALTDELLLFTPQHPPELRGATAPARFALAHQHVVAAN